MREAEEILRGLMGNVRYELNGKSANEETIRAMQAYAKDAIDRCAEVAETKKVSNSGSWLDASIDKQSILKVKQELK